MFKCYICDSLLKSEKFLERHERKCTLRVKTENIKLKDEIKTLKSLLKNTEIKEEIAIIVEKPLTYINHFLHPSVKHVDPNIFLNKYLKNTNLIKTITIDFFQLLYFDSNIYNHSIYYTKLESSSINVFENGDFISRPIIEVKDKILNSIEVLVNKLLNVINDETINEIVDDMYKNKDADDEFSKMLIIAYKNKNVVKNTIDKYKIVSRIEFEKV